MKKFLCIVLMLAAGAISVYADDPNAFLDEYGKEVQGIIKSNLKYNGDKSAITSVTYQINSDGSVTDIKLDKASGTEFDNAVINAVKKSAPFKPFPKDSNIRYITMTSGFQHTVQSYQTARMAILPVEPSAESQQAYRKYMDKVGKFVFDRIPTVYTYIPKEPVIKCTILKDGTVRNFRLTESSGIEEYDKKIMNTYANMKFPPFPQELSQYDELPYSVKIYSRIRTTRPDLGTPNFIFH